MFSNILCSYAIVMRLGDIATNANTPGICVAGTVCCKDLLEDPPQDIALRTGDVLRDLSFVWWRNLWGPGISQNCVGDFRQMGARIPCHGNVWAMGVLEPWGSIIWSEQQEHGLITHACLCEHQQRKVLRAGGCSCESGRLISFNLVCQ